MTNNSKRVLFLYISPSSGHQHAADAVREAFSILAPAWQTYGVDSFSYAYPKIGKLIARTYLELLRRTPAIWDYVYDNPDVETATREIREVLNLISSPRMRTLMDRYQPDALVCTQAAPCSVFAAEKRRGDLTIPLIAVVTDFAIHSYWVHPEVDLYCVASEEARRDLIRYGIPVSRIVVTGIPISPTFLQNSSKKQIRMKMGLDPVKPTALIMGGSQGLGPLHEMLALLRHLPLQCIVAAGLNRDLFRELKKTYAQDDSIKVFGYTRMVNQFMDAADFLISKPGGLTSSEALAKNLPMVLTNSIPGQEERNARYLLKQGAGVRADSPEEIAAHVKHLLDRPAALQKMSEKSGTLAKPYAALEVARWVFRLATQNARRYVPPVRTVSRMASWAARREYDRIPRVP